MQNYTAPEVIIMLDYQTKFEVYMKLGFSVTVNK